PHVRRHGGQSGRPMAHALRRAFGRLASALLVGRPGGGVSPHGGGEHLGVPRAELRPLRALTPADHGLPSCHAVPHRGGDGLSEPISGRAFVKRATRPAAALVGAPLVRPGGAAAAGERLVVAVGQWGIETPFAWRSSQSEKTLWDCAYDPLIMRDPKT